MGGFQSAPPARGATIERTSPISVEDAFQSAPPARGATGRPGRPSATAARFNPRPPHGGRHCAVAKFGRQLDVSIRAPRTGGDEHEGRYSGGRVSIRAPRTGGDSCAMVMADFDLFVVSIRAPRTGGDLMRASFNPRPPHGGRPLREGGRTAPNVLFQSAPPARGATVSSYLIVVELESGRLARTRLHEYGGMGSIKKFLRCQSNEIMKITSRAKPPAKT